MLTGVDYKRNEFERLIAVMDSVLESRTFLAHDDYSIADMAAWPWVLAIATSMSAGCQGTSTSRVPRIYSSTTAAAPSCP